MENTHLLCIFILIYHVCKKALLRHTIDIDRFDEIFFMSKNTADAKEKKYDIKTTINGVFQ